LASGSVVALYRFLNHVGHKRLKKRHVRLSLGSAVLPMGVRKKSKMAAIWGVILSYL
jgi:hypothetical protein